MARVRIDNCRFCRREGIKLYLKGAKCESPKCPVEKRPFPPGVHGRARQRDKEYLQRLREKQKARRIYGILEKQFHKYYVMASREKGVTGTNLLRILESRLDNVVFRAGFAHSRDDARQLALHRHITVNGRITNIPSALLKPGDVVAVRDKAKSNVKVLESMERAQSRTIPSWLSVNNDSYEARVVSAPERADIDVPVKESFIVEFYSR